MESTRTIRKQVASNIIKNKIYYRKEENAPNKHHQRKKEPTQVNKKKGVKGDIVRHAISSINLDNKRFIDIYLPPNYKASEKRYPVLYMHDGNNLFDPSISFGGMDWKIDYVVEDLVEKGLMNEIIVVGVHNTNRRDFEYTWLPMKFGRQIQGGGGEKYAKFLIEELKPFIDKNFKTLTSRENTAVMGSSLGGLISFYLGLHHSDTFSKIGVMSPSLWWGYGIALEHAKKMPKNLKIWLDMGTREGGGAKSEGAKQNITITRMMKMQLQKVGYIQDKDLGYIEAEGAMHNEWSWYNRVHLPISFFFGNNNNV